MIYASSPEAKGRVERANSTLQDRLIKMMRLDGISSIEEANKYVAGFIKKHNEKFAKPAADKANAHCFVEEEEKLQKAFSVQTQKKLSKTLSFQHNLYLYQIKDEGQRRLQHKHVTLYEHHKVKPTIYLEAKELNFSMQRVEKRTPEIHNEKTLNAKLDTLKSDATQVAVTQQSSNAPWLDYQRIERKIAFS